MPLFHQWDAENIYLILEWCSGGDLSRFIRSRRILPERVARRFLQQMGQSLQVSFIDFFFFSFSREFQHFSWAKQTWTLCGKTCRTHFYGRKTYTFFCHLNLVVCVSVQTACALQFLHERNISHLDLKPQNILLSGSVLKLAGDHMPTSSQTIKQMRMNFACGWDHICIMPDIFKCHVSFTPICFRTKKLCLNMKL